MRTEKLLEHWRIDAHHVRLPYAGQDELSLNRVTRVVETGNLRRDLEPVVVDLVDEGTAGLADPVQYLPATRMRFPAQHDDVGSSDRGAAHQCLKRQIERDAPLPVQTLKRLRYTDDRRRIEAREHRQHAWRAHLEARPVDRLASMTIAGSTGIRYR